MKLIIEVEVYESDDEYSPTTSLEAGDVTVRTVGLTPQQKFVLSEQLSKSDWLVTDLADEVLDQLT